MTSNVGARLISKGKSLGFLIQEDIQHDYQNIKETLTEEMKKTFNPEFLNRVDDIIVFHPLGREEMIKILDLMLERGKSKLIAHGFNIELDNEAKEYLLEKGFDPQYGARPVQRVIQRYVEDPLAESILSNQFVHKQGEPPINIVVTLNKETKTLEFKLRDKTECVS